MFTKISFLFFYSLSFNVCQLREYNDDLVVEIEELRIEVIIIYFDPHLQHRKLTILILTVWKEKKSLSSG